MQERRNSIALAMELCLPCTNPLICGDMTVTISSNLHNGISYTGKLTSSHWNGSPKLEAGESSIGIPGNGLAPIRWQTRVDPNLRCYMASVDHNMKKVIWLSKYTYPVLIWQITITCTYICWLARRAYHYPTSNTSFYLGNTYQCLAQDCSIFDAFAMETP